MSVSYTDLPLTTFPEVVDTIKLLLNITTTDGPLVQSYQNYIKVGNFASAQEVLNQIPNADQKILTPEYFNTLRDATLALERFYKSDVQPYITTKQAEWEVLVNNLTFSSAYSTGTQYVKNNYVSYVADGETNLYIAIANPPVGTTPTNTTYWRKFTVKGSKGDSGPGASFMYEWNSSTPYVAQDIVSWANKWFIATSANTNQTPFDGSPYWSVILEMISTAYPVQPNEPTGQNNGDLWFQTV